MIRRVTSTQPRLEPSSFPVLIERTARYSDLDPSRRIGRDALIRWFEDARVAVELDALGADLDTRTRAQVRLLLASVRVDVLALLRVAGVYRVGLGVTRIGKSAFTYAYAVFAGDECVATGESVSVHVTDEGPAPLPDPIRSALAELHLDVLGYPSGGPLDGLSPSSLHVEYLAEVLDPGIYQLRVGVLELDDATVRYACGLFDGPRCIGLADAVGAPAEQDIAEHLAAWRMRRA
jgi:acyl-CoA thioester hydrolase